MKRRDRTRINTLLDAKTDQSQVIYFPDNWNRTYNAYTKLQSGGLSRGRATAKYVVKQALLLGLWIGALALMLSQSGMLHQNHQLSSPDTRIEANLNAPAKGTL